MVVGAGPGLGAAVARRFGREGYAAGLVARSAGELADLVEDLAGDGIEAWPAALDVTDPNPLAAAVAGFGERAGRIDVLHFNPSRFRERGPLELTPAELAEDVLLGAGALLPAVQAARPYFRAGSRVTATGSLAADKPWHRAASLGVQKAALRNLVRSLDAALSPDGVRAVSVTVNGTLEEGTAFDVRRVAEAIHAAAVRDEGAWTAEVAYDG